MNANTLESTRELIKKANTVLILTHERPTADSIASALTLSLALQTLGKKVTVACPDQITVEHSNFVGANKIVSEISKKNFIISLDYVDGSIEKVSYNIEGNTFNLVIEPRDGYDGFSEDKVHFRKAGVSADLIIVVDTIQLGGLKKLYELEKELFTTVPVINIDRHPNNAHFGQVNIVNAQASATIELVYSVLETLDIRMNQDIAMNILNALYSATNNFTAGNVSASVFELAAEAIKAGGKRFRRTVETAATNLEPVSVGTDESTTEVANTNNHDNSSQPQAKKETPADWLKPKIFKSSHAL